MVSKLIALQRQLNQLIQCDRGLKTLLANSTFGQLFMFYIYFIKREFDLKLLFCCLATENKMFISVNVQL